MVSKPSGQPPRGISTRSVYSPEPGAASGTPVVIPLLQSSTFFFDGSRDSPGDLRYTRFGNNPNQTAVARKMAVLEGMEDSVFLGSGMAATAMTLLALLRRGEHVVASRFL